MSRSTTRCISPQISHGYNTDWQVNCADTKQRVARLYQSGEWTDCSFKFGNEVVKAHKLVLAMSSPVFASMFYGLLSEDGPINIIDVQATTFKSILEYIYTDSVNITLNSAFDIYYAANKYQLPHLIKRCNMYVCKSLDPINVCQMYEFACFYEEKKLVDECLQMISAKTMQMLKSKCFLKVNINTMNKILDMDSLNIESEMNLFDAILRYKCFMKNNNDARTPTKNTRSKASKQPDCSDMIASEVVINERGEEHNYTDALNVSSDSMKDLTISTKDDSSTSTSLGRRCRKRRRVPVEKDTPEPKLRDKNNSRSASPVPPEIRSMVQKLRFLSLTPKEFASNYKSLSTLLTKDEIFALNMNIASLDTDVPMPEGFCTNRVPRNKSFRGGDVTKVVYRSVVRDIKKLEQNEEYEESNTFYARDIPWHITIHRTDDREFGVFITCGLCKSQPWSCNVNYEIRLISYKPGVNPLFHKTSQLFTRKDNDWGCSFPWNDVMDPYKGYVKDNEVTYEVHISPDEPSYGTPRKQKDYTRATMSV